MKTTDKTVAQMTPPALHTSLRTHITLLSPVTGGVTAPLLNKLVSLKKYLGKGLSDDTDGAFLNRPHRPWTLNSA